MAGLTLREIANAIGETVVGRDDIVIGGASSVSDALEDDIVLAENAKYLALAEKSMAAAIVTSDEVVVGKSRIVSDDPRRAFAAILGLFAPKMSRPAAGIDPSCRVGERVSLGDGASIGFGCWIGDDVSVGEGAVVHPFAYIGDGVRIGEGSIVHPHVTIYYGCEIGCGVVIHSGVVIGSDGFGYIPVGQGLMKVPQIGNVVIEDDVEIGANSTIDRAKTGSTRIGRGSKIDNLVQIAHNCEVGEMCVIAGQTGISGSAEIGSGVSVGGQAGFRDHVKVGDGAMIGGRSGVMVDVAAGAVVSGYPARPHGEDMRSLALIVRLPEMKRTIDRLNREVEMLKAQLSGDKDSE